jgi:hypothetical protein
MVGELRQERQGLDLRKAPPDDAEIERAYDDPGGSSGSGAASSRPVEHQSPAE